MFSVNLILVMFTVKLKYETLQYPLIFNPLKIRSCIITLPKFNTRKLSDSLFTIRLTLIWHPVKLRRLGFVN